MRDYFCIFGGGGVRGIAYVGALRALLEAGVNIIGLAGSSIGSVFAALYSFGYSADEIQEILVSVKTELFKDINFDFGKDFSLSKGEKFLTWMRELIESKHYGQGYKKGKMPPVKFKDTDCNLIVLSTNLTDSTFKEFSRYKTPDAEIAYAVRASVSIPGLYKPVYQDGEIIVDGDLVKSWPLWRLSPNLCPLDARILEFRLEDTQKEKKIETALSYLNAVYNTISGFATDFILDLYRERDKFDYIKINSKDISVLDFRIPSEKRYELIRVGYETTSEYFQHKLPIKQKKLFDIYYEIKLILARMLFELDKKNNVKNSYCILAELFIELCEYKRVIDSSIYEKIIEFKNLFKRNYKIVKFFFIDGATLSDKYLVTCELKEIISSVEAKTIELRT